MKRSIHVAFGALIVACGVGASVAGAYQYGVRTTARDAAAASIEARSAWAKCGAVTVLVIGVNAYGAGEASHVASRACDDGHSLPEEGDGVAMSGFRVEER